LSTMTGFFLFKTLQPNERGLPFAEIANF